MAPRKAGRKHRAKKEPTEREKLLERIKDMGDGEFAEVQDLISGSSQGESIQGLTGTVGVDTAAPPTAFPVRRTLGDNVPDDGGKGGGMLGKLKGLVSGPPIETTTRGPRKSNRPGTMHRTEVKKEAASSGSNVGAGYQYPLGTPAPTAPSVSSATTPAAGAGTGAGREVTASQRAAEAAKRAYLAQRERTRGAGGGGGPAPAAPAVNPSARGPQASQPPKDQAIRGPLAPAMTQGNTTGTQSTNPKRRIGNLQKDGAGGYEDFGQSSATPPPKKKGNPLTEGSFSTADIVGNAAIEDPFAAKKTPQGAQMRAPIKDSGAVRPDVAEEQEASRLEAEISNLMKMGGPASTDRLKEIFGSLQEAMNLDEGAMGPNAARSNPQRKLEGTIVPWGEEGPRSRSNQLGPRQKKLSQGAAAKLLKQYGPQFRALSTRNVSRGSKVARR